jgi:hypothetical protein
VVLELRVRVVDDLACSSSNTNAFSKHSYHEVKYRLISIAAKMLLVKRFCSEGKPKEVVLVTLVLADDTMSLLALERCKKCHRLGLEDSSKSEHIRYVLNIVFFLNLFFDGIAMLEAILKVLEETVLLSRIVRLEVGRAGSNQWIGCHII